jgi:hypothetical protein
LARATRQRDLLAENLAASADHREIAELARKLAEVSAEMDRLENSWLEVAEAGG